jgi:uncharacterized protein YecT (DUF1311 family)
MTGGLKSNVFKAHAVAWCAALLLSVVAPHVRAQMPSFADSKAYQDCMDRSYSHGFITENRVNCVRAELKKYDAMLNAEYQLQLKSLQGESRKKLVQAQRDWVKFRDAWCGFEFTLVDVPPNIYVKREMCLTDFTIEQWYRLKSMH